MITINGLKPHQVKLLDLMWSINSPEDYEEFKSQLSEDMMNEVDTLEQLVIFATIDEEMEETLTDAKEALSKFAL
jgi:transcriptional regulator of NAD metabolism